MTNKAHTRNIKSGSRKLTELFQFKVMNLLTRESEWTLELDEKAIKTEPTFKPSKKLDNNDIYSYQSCRKQQKFLTRFFRSVIALLLTRKGSYSYSKNNQFIFQNGHNTSRKGKMFIFQNNQNST